jgi:hypothetical protein
MKPIVPPAGERRAGDHRAHAFVAAHRVDGDTRQAHALSPLSRSGLEPDGDDLSSVIVAAMRTQVVRALQFTAVAALVEGFDLQGIVRAAVAPAMRRYFSLGDSHCGTCSFKSLIANFRNRP